LFYFIEDEMNEANKRLEMMLRKYLLFYMPSALKVFDK